LRPLQASRRTFVKSRIGEVKRLLHRLPQKAGETIERCFIVSDNAFRFLIENHVVPAGQECAFCRKPAPAQPGAPAVHW
jgi:hypothetical protein